MWLSCEKMELWVSGQETDTEAQRWKLLPGKPRSSIMELSKAFRAERALELNLFIQHLTDIR